MKTWPTKKLGEVCEIFAGGSAPQGERFFENGEYPFFRTSDVGAVHLSDSLCDVRDYLNDEGIKKLNLFKKGTILFPKSGASTFLNHRVVMGCDGYVASHLATISAGEKIDFKYLYFFLTLVDAKDIAPNSSYPSLRISDIAKIKIPLPPLEIQKKVVKKIEGLFAKITQAQSLRDSSVRDVEALISLVIRKYLEEIRKKFDSKELGNITKLVRGPFGGSLRKDIFVKSGYAIYEQGNVIKSKLTDFRYFITTQKFSEMKRFAVQAGDILMSCSGTIGRLLVIPEEFTRGIINQALLKITPGKTITVEYLKYVLQDYISQNIASNTKGSAIKNIVAVAFLKKIKIPLPPIAEQKKIVTQLDALTQKVRQLQKLQSETAANLTALKQSILHKAFQGEL